VAVADVPAESLGWQETAPERWAQGVGREAYFPLTEHPDELVIALDGQNLGHLRRALAPAPVSPSAR
jgi:hypothetical protein